METHKDAKYGTIQYQLLQQSQTKRFLHKRIKVTGYFTQSHQSRKSIR